MRTGEATSEELPRANPKIRRAKLTDRTCRHLKPAPEGRRYDVWDTLCPGLSVRVTDRGRKSWTVLGRLHRRALRVTLGAFPALGVAAARVEARDALEKIAKGRNPLRSRATLSFKEAFATYEKDRRSTWSVRHARNIHSAFVVHAEPAFGSYPLHTIERRQLVVLLADVARAHPVAANRLREYLRTFFRWAIERELIEIDPTAVLRKPTREKGRDRVYSDPEIRAVWNGCGVIGWPYGELVRFALVTAQRKGQVGEMRREQIDRARAIWTAPTKAGRLHPLPLSPLALEILADADANHALGPVVFSVFGKRGVTNWNYPTAKLRKLEGVPLDFRLHDLRRTAATRMQELGVRGEIVDAVLDHAKGGVSGVYQRYGYVEEMRHALTLWSDRLRQILAAS